MFSLSIDLGTKREAPAAASRSGGARRGRGGARGGGRGSKRAKKEDSEEEEEEQDDDEDKPSGPVLWRVALTEEKTSIFAIYINDKAVYAGDEEGNVVELGHKYMNCRAFFFLLLLS